MSYEIIATITDKGRSAIADMLDSGLSFTITHFVTGGGGHDTSDPQVPLTPDPASITMPNQTFGPKLLAQKIKVNQFCNRYVGFLDYNEAVGNLSNYGLVAQYIYSPNPNDPLIGQTFLYAVGNSPLIVKTDAETREINIEVEV